VAGVVPPHGIADQTAKYQIPPPMSAAEARAGNKALGGQGTPPAGWRKPPQGVIEVPEPVRAWRKANPGPEPFETGRPGLPQGQAMPIGTNTKGKELPEPPPLGFTNLKVPVTNENAETVDLPPWGDIRGREPVAENAKATETPTAEPANPKAVEQAEAQAPPVAAKPAEDELTQALLDTAKTPEQEAAVLKRKPFGKRNVMPADEDTEAAIAQMKGPRETFSAPRLERLRRLAEDGADTAGDKRSLTWLEKQGYIRRINPKNGDEAVRYDLTPNGRLALAQEPRPQSLSAGAPNSPISTAPRLYAGVGARPLTPPQQQTPHEQAANAFQDYARIMQNNKVADQRDMIMAMQEGAKLAPKADMPAIYRKVEAGQQLTGDEKALWDRTFAPLHQEWRDFLDQEIGEDRMRDLGQSGPNSIPLIEEKDFAKWMEEPSNADPVMGNFAGKRFLRQNDRSFSNAFMEAVDAKGNKRVVQLNPDNENFRTWDNGTPREYQNLREIKNGATVAMDGRNWKLRPTTADAIEASGAKDMNGNPYRFVKNPVALMKSVLDAREIQANRQVLDHLTSDPAYANSMMSNPNNSEARMAEIRNKGFIESNLPELRGKYFAPDLAWALNDFQQVGFGGDLGAIGKMMTNINKFLVGSIFWNPIPHLFNTAYHWGVGRGFDWLKPTGWAKLAKTGAQAIHEVATQGPAYRQMLRDGAPMMWPGMQAAHAGKLIGRMGEVSIAQEPAFWRDFMKMTGIKNAAELTKMWYDGAQRVLWQGGDVMTMQRILENQAKGMPLDQAIASTRTHLPDYTIPYKVWGDRAMSQLLQDPRNILSVFNRYHYGLFKSLAKITNDTVNPKVPWEMRKEAIGNALALAALSYVVQPALSAGWQKLTGNKNAEANYRGPLAPIHAASEWLHGRKDFAQALGGAFTMSPFTRMALDAFTNHDWKNKTIVTPAGSAKQQIGQIAGHGLNYVSPFQQFGPAFTDAHPLTKLAKTFMEQVGDFKSPDAKQMKGKQAGQKFRDREAAARVKKPDNVFEAGFNKLFHVKPPYRHSQ
jgi:hypothetical protein